MNFHAPSNSEISRKFSQNPEKSLFIPYFSLGDPNYESSVDWAGAILEGGGDMLELGIPFSDPIADGPVIQRAFTRALKHSFSFDTIFEITRTIKSAYPTKPLIYLTYFNPIYQYGLERFLSYAKSAGVSGLIIPDLPFDTPESEELFSEAILKGFDLIHLVTPATEKKRIREMKKTSSGFIYYVTSFGVTGERVGFSEDLEKRICWVRKEMRIPVACGFGISTPEQAQKISQFADGVIIGSAIQRIIEQYGSDTKICMQKLKEYCSLIRQKMK